MAPAGLRTVLNLGLVWLALQSIAVRAGPRALIDTSQSPHAKMHMVGIGDVSFVPYYAWGNRGDTEMTVWLPARSLNP